MNYSTLFCNVLITLLFVGTCFLAEYMTCVNDPLDDARATPETSDADRKPLVVRWWYAPIIILAAFGASYVPSTGWMNVIAVVVSAASLAFMACNKAAIHGKMQGLVTATFTSLVCWMWLGYSRAPMGWLVINLTTILVMIFVLSEYAQHFRWPIIRIALVSLTIFDVISVFVTGHMIDIAAASMKAGFPGLVYFPDFHTWKPIMILGAGDIVFPGTLMILAITTGYETKRWLPMWGTLAGFIAGQMICTLVLIFFHWAKPAMLYLVPGVLIGYRAAVALIPHEHQAEFLS